MFLQTIPARLILLSTPAHHLSLSTLHLGYAQALGPPILGFIKRTPEEFTIFGNQQRLHFSICFQTQIYSISSVSKEVMGISYMMPFYKHSLNIEIWNRTTKIMVSKKFQPNLLHLGDPSCQFCRHFRTKRPTKPNIAMRPCLSSASEKTHRARETWKTLIEPNFVEIWGLVIVETGYQYTVNNETQ